MNCHIANKPEKQSIACFSGLFMCFFEKRFIEH